MAGSFDTSRPPSALLAATSTLTTQYAVMATRKLFLLPKVDLYLFIFDLFK